METFSFSPLINLVEEEKWLLAVISFEASTSLLNRTDENTSFSIGKPGYWKIPNYLPYGTIDKLKELLKLRSANDIELHVKEVQRRGTRIEIENSGYNLTSFDHFKSEILAELGRKFHHLEDMVYRMELTYDEIMDVLEIKYTSATSIGYTLPPGIYEISDLISMINSLLPDGVKVNITIDDIRLRSNLTTNKTIKLP